MMRKGFSELTREVSLKCGRQPSYNSLYYTTFYDFVPRICSKNRPDPFLTENGSADEETATGDTRAIKHLHF
ncbi:hypothetical protein SAMN02927897_04578 [Kosakonia sacchari]|uniref:Uncharacterized protein n=1 Tax=Kosakonia sacchari TaxID=1158459 RepID=A0A1G4ZCY2_9ENTR|nr:hypothetical protein SAMN02927897_04578 [Kosakonia sacchari]